MALALPPDVLEFVRRQAMQATGAPSPDDTAAPQDAAPAPAAPAQPSPIDSYTQAIRDFVSNYGNPQALAEAQARDRANIEANRFAQGMGNATGLMINNPGAVKVPEAVPLDVKNYLERLQLGKDTLGMQGQALTMPYTLRKTMAETAKAEAEPGKIQAETAATIAGIPKTQAEARKATAEAQGSEIENGPAAPAMLAMGEKLGVRLPPETTNKQAREILDAEAKRQGIQLDWSKLGLDQFKTRVEMARYDSEHPNEPVPGLKYVGPGAAPSRDSEPVKALAQAKQETDTVKGDLAELKRIYNDASYRERVMGSKSQALDTLHERVMGALGRAAANGRLAAYDVELAKQQLPVPSTLRGAWQSGRMNSAIDMIVSRLDAGFAAQARAHNFQLEGAPPASASAPKRIKVDAEGNVIGG